MSDDPTDATRAALAKRIDRDAALIARTPAALDLAARRRGVQQARAARERMRSIKHRPTIDVIPGESPNPRGTR